MAEGNCFKDVQVADEFYNQSASHYKSVAEQLKSQMMDKSVMAARNWDGYAALMRNWGFAL